MYKFETLDSVLIKHISKCYMNIELCVMNTAGDAHKKKKYVCALSAYGVIILLNTIDTDS